MSTEKSRGKTETYMATQSFTLIKLVTFGRGGGKLCLNEGNASLTDDKIHLHGFLTPGFPE